MLTCHKAARADSFAGRCEEEMDMIPGTCSVSSLQRAS